MAVKTDKTYQSGVNAYHKFCRQAQCTPFPITQKGIAYFVSIYFSKHYNIQDGMMLKAAVTLAFFGMLRCGEYTSPTKTFWDPQVNLGYRDVKFQAGGKKLTVHIKDSKMDPFPRGIK